MSSRRNGPCQNGTKTDRGVVSPKVFYGEKTSPEGIGVVNYNAGYKKYRAS